ncbi:MAG: hypothetical protein AAI978_00525 [Candidatus Hodgkinia cicadicola]
MKTNNSNLENITKALTQRNKTEGIIQQIKFKDRRRKLKSKLKQEQPNTSLETQSWEFQEVN